MRILTLLFTLSFSYAFSQITATITAPSTLCSGTVTAEDFIFTANGGTAPYTFEYSVNGGTPTSLTTITGNTVSPSSIQTLAYTYVYTLISVTDASTVPQAIGSDFTFVIHATPTVTGITNICVGSSSLLTGSGTPNSVTPWISNFGSGIATVSSNGAISGAAPGMSTVIYTTIDGCSTSVPVTISPQATINGTTTMICQGGNMVFTASGTPATMTPWISSNPAVAIIDNVGVITGVSPGSSVITYEDNNGCTASQTILVNMTPVVNAGPDVSYCYGSQAFFEFSGAQTYTYSPAINSNNSWGPSTIIPGVQVYTVIGTSSAGCSNMDQVTITVMDQPISPVVSIDSSQCNDGSIIVENAATSNYTYQWSTGSTLSFIDHLAPGNYSLSVQDNTSGCLFEYSYTVLQTVIPGDCGEITGSVRYDHDQSCSVTSGDVPVASRIIQANPGNYFVMSDVNGNYSFTLPYGTYTISEVFNPADNMNANFCNPSYTVALSASNDSIGGNHFYDTIRQVIDLVTYCYSGTVIPGFNFFVSPTFFDNGNVGNSILGGLDGWVLIPSGTNLVNWNYPHTVSNDTIYFTLTSNQTYYGQLQFVASNVTLGSSLIFCAGIETVNTEIASQNNIYCGSTIVVGSFDPNDKRMFLNGTLSDSTIELTDSILDYVVRFQNTGTAPAQNIYVLDTISENLDISTFKFISSSYPCTISLLDNHILRFDFSQIFLPDSNTNEPESHGYFHYQIHQNEENIIGDIINNTAYIYFDFNEAVITNTTIDTIVQPSTISVTENSLDRVTIFPNPAHKFINIHSNTWMQEIKLFSVTGDLITTFPVHANSFEIDVNSWIKGIYFLEISSSQGVLRERIIVQ